MNVSTVAFLPLMDYGDWRNQRIYVPIVVLVMATNYASACGSWRRVPSHCFFLLLLLREYI